MLRTWAGTNVRSHYCLDLMWDTAGCMHPVTQKYATRLQWRECVGRARYICERRTGDPDTSNRPQRRAHFRAHLRAAHTGQDG